MDAKQTIIECATLLKLHYVKVDLEQTICQAQIDKPTYMTFLAQVLKHEVEGRQQRDQQRRLTLAHLPSQHDLDNFDFRWVLYIQFLCLISRTRYLIRQSSP